MGIIEDHDDRAVGLQPAEHLDQGRPDMFRCDTGALSGPYPGQLFRRRLARFRHELRH